MIDKMTGRRCAWRVLLAGLLLIGVPVAGVSAQAGLLSTSSLVEDDATYVSGRVIVRYGNLDAAKSHLGLAGPRSSLSIASALSRSLLAGARVQRDLSKMARGLCAVDLPAGMSVQDGVRHFAASPGVAYAEPDYILRLAQGPFPPLPSDPRFGEQWGLHSSFFGSPDINAPEAWEAFTAEAPDIVVAVLDTGIDYMHPDLHDNMWHEPNIPEDFNEADPNTYPEDDTFDPAAPEDYEPWWLYGYDFVDDDADPNDEVFHGTHVAGIIGAVGNNGEGVVGVCHSIQMMAVRVFSGDPFDPTDANAVSVEVSRISDGIAYALEKGAQIVNLSGGVPNVTFSQTLYNDATDLRDAGVVLVAAAGNEAEENARIPARYGTNSMGFQRLDNVISVAATTRADTLASFSDYGVDYTHLGAPGERILSTMPRIATDTMNASVPALATDYDYLDGTSMAAPFVTGACALAKVVNPDVTPAGLQRRLASPRAVEPVLPDLVESGGRLNLYKFLRSVFPGVIRNITQGQDYAWNELQKAIDEAQDGDDLIAQHSAVYPVEEPLTYDGKNITLRSGDVEDMYYEPNEAEIDQTAIWGPRGEGPVVYLDVDDGSDLSAARLVGFTIEYGDQYEGGIQMRGVSPRIQRCVVQHNIGGGIISQGGSVIFQDGKVRFNMSLQSGGGIYAGVADRVIVEGSLIADNNSVEGFGGGLAIDEALEATVTDCNFVRNWSAWPGGGLCLYEVGATVSHCDFSLNRSLREGGAVYSQGGSAITLQDNRFMVNYAEVAGGAVYCEENDTTLTNNLFAKNTVNGQYGGALFCVDSSPAVNNCTFVGNDVLALEGLGGAIFCQQGYVNLGSSPVISNCIFADNNDIAIVEDDAKSQPTVRYSLFHNNQRGDFFDVDTGTNFLISATEAGVLVPGEQNRNGDPMFVPGRLGPYYLSQFAAGQILDVNGLPTVPDGDPNQATSPAVDTGSDLAETLGMAGVSTRTDNYADPNTGARDSGLVDLGYHYLDDQENPSVRIRVSTVPRNRGQLNVIFPAGVQEYRQWSQVLIEAVPKDPNAYWFKQWTGTDDDGRLDLGPDGRPAPVQRNVVTVGLGMSPAQLAAPQDVRIGIEFETVLVQLVAYVDSGNGVVTPERGFFERGSTVPLQVDTDVHPVRVRWFGTDDDTRLVKNNAVTLLPPFAVDPKGRERKEVRIQLYRPRILRVPSHDYVTINEAILDANDGDIVALAESELPYLTFEGFTLDRAITITGEHPDDPNSVRRTVIEMATLGAGPVGPAFMFMGVGRDTVLNGLTIRGFRLSGGNGRGGTAPAAMHWGGKGGDTPGPAIHLQGASPVIKNCVFVDNVAIGGNGGNGSNASQNDVGGRGGWPGQALGGALAALNGSDPCVVNCVFERCQAFGGNGGDGGNLPAGTPGWPGPGGGWDPRWNESWPGGSRLVDPEFWSFDPVEWIASDSSPEPPDLDLPYTGLGGAVFVDRYSSPVFRNCSFRQCASFGGRVGLAGTYPGGGRDESKVNWQIDSFGGAVYIGQYSYDFSSPLLFFFGDPFGFGSGPVADVSKARFIECSFTDNVTGTDPNDPVLDLWTSYGGAVAVGRGADPSFERCTFSRNNADMGGGLYVSDKAALTLTNSTVSANTAFTGGGLANQEAMLTVDRTVFTENRASHEDGVYTSDPNVTFSDEMGRGGALLVEDGTALVKNSQLRENHAGAAGGGLYSAGATVLLHNDLITDNEAGRMGGGVAATLFADTEIRNSTIMSNLVDPTALLGQLVTPSAGRGGLFTPGTTPVRWPGFGGGLYTTRDSVTRVFDTLLWANVADPADANNTGDQIAVRSGFDFTDDYRGALGEGEPNDQGLEYSEGAARVYVQHSDIGPSPFSDVIVSSAWPVYQEDPGRVFGWDPNSQTWDPNTFNLSEDPRLTAGFYLSHMDAGQAFDSPLIDAGSQPVDDPNILLADATSRTDGVPDMGLVDIGFHYSHGIRSYLLKVTISPDAEDGQIHGTVDPNEKVVFEGIGTNVVTLTATPEPGYRVRGWAGTDNDGSTERTNTVTVTGDTVVRVGFEKLSVRKLTVPGDYPTIQEAITVAREGDEVIVDPGTYFMPGSSLNGYSLEIDKAVTVRSINPEDPCTVAATIIDGYATVNTEQNMLGVMFGRNSSGAVFNGLTIQNVSGKAGNGDDGDRDLSHPNGYDGGFILGGGIYVAQGAAPIIKNCIIRNCQLEGGDGGTGVDAEAGDDTTLVGTFNAGRGGWSGFVHGAGAFCAVGSRPHFINCTFENNMARGGNAGDGGDYADNGAGAGFGGNYSPTDYIDYDPCNLGPTPSPVPLWQTWRWDGAFTYAHWDDIMSGALFEMDLNDLQEEALLGGPYIGDYRWYSGYGGGVYCDEGSHATFEHCTFRGNQTFGGQSGVGGVLADGSDDIRAPIQAYELPSYGAGVYGARDSVLVFQGCTFEDNVASGAVNVSPFGNAGDGTTTTGGDPNFALDPYLGWGGGVCAEQTAALTFVDCNFADNGAQTGGALFLGKTNAEIVGSHIVRNTALRGGGVYGDDGDILIRDCNIVGNWARMLDANDVNDVNALIPGADVNDVNEPNPLGYGAGLALINSTAEVWDSNIYSNDARMSGGGLYIRGGSPSLVNVLFHQNAAGRDGGAASLNAETTATLRNCTFYANGALGTTGDEDRTGYGGAIYAGHLSDVTILDSILWQDSAPHGGEIAVGSGAQFEPACSTVTVAYSTLFTGHDESLYEDPGCQIVQGQGMRYDDPQFRNGLLGGFYLASVNQGHGVQSPAIDAGSDMAGRVGMAQTSTQTDQGPDKGIVDMGYHHVMREPCRICDLKFDGLIDGTDFALFAQQWLRSGCGDPDWCGGADFTFDTAVDSFDMLFFSDCWLVQDVTPPRDNPPTWSVVPALEAGKIVMAAETATDLWGWRVEYYFENTSGNGHDSGWISGRHYIDYVDDVDGSYTYRFKVREARPNGNETRWSDSRTVHALPTPPIGALALYNVPDELTAAALTVVGNPLEHPGGVHYRFQMEDGELTDWASYPPVDANGVIDPNGPFVPTHRFTGLEPDTDYRVRYQARSADQDNIETGWSEWLTIHTLAATTGIDVTPPTPNPMEFAPIDVNGVLPGTPVGINLTQGTFSWHVEMTAALATDDSGGVVEYIFECVTDPRFSSDWQIDPFYEILTGVHPGYAGLGFRVKARDEFGNETLWSQVFVAPLETPATPVVGGGAGGGAAGGGAAGGGAAGGGAAGGGAAIVP